MRTIHAANGTAALALSLGIACGPSTPPRPPTVPDIAGKAIDAAVETVPEDAAQAIVKTPAKRPRIEAPHGGTIIELAATADGTAVITADDLGGVRLWPKLDGTVEPRVVDLPRPKRLALAADARGFLIAMIDEVGGLTVQLIDRDGVTLQTAVHGFDPPHQDLVITDRGPLALRSDQRLLRFAPDGAVTGQLAGEAGQRIVAIGASGSRMIAVVEGGRDKPWRRARWIASSDQLAWGAWVPGNDAIGDPIAIAPNGKRLAFLVGPKNGKKAIVIDASDGKEVLAQVAPNVTAIGFADDDNVAVDGNLPHWFDLSGAKGNPPAPGFSQSGTLAVGGGRAISGLQSQLVIATPGVNEFLGYAMPTPSVTAPGPQGTVLLGHAENVVLLDRELRDRPAPDLQLPTQSVIAAVKHLAGNDWVVELTKLSDGTTSVLLVDAAAKKSVPLRAGMTMAHLLAYEPTTQTLALSLGEQPELFHHEPGKLKVDRIAVLPKQQGYERMELFPLDPKVANGTQVVAIQLRERATVRWARDPRAIDKGVSVTIDGSPAGVDPSGLVYMWEATPTGALELAMYRDAKRIGTLPTQGPTALWPDPRGSGQTVQVSQRTVALVGSDGKKKWAQALQGVTESVWLDDGSIVIISAAGIARLDGKTGTPTATRCGWKFGLSKKMNPVAARFEPLCTQLR